MELIKSINPANAKTIGDIVYETLRQAILEGELKNGDRMVEKDLAERLKVSRTPIREAIRKLEMEGLAGYLPRKGLVVRGITAEGIIEIYAIREALEAAAITFIIQNITEDDKKRLYRLTSEMRQMIAEENDAELFRLSQLFNEILVRSSKMPRLIGLINTYQEYLAKFRKLTMSRQPRKHAALKEHEEIVRAIDEKDERRAKELMLQHLRAACQECLKTFAQK